MVLQASPMDAMLEALPALALCMHGRANTQVPFIYDRASWAFRTRGVRAQGLTPPPKEDGQQLACQCAHHRVPAGLQDGARDELEGPQHLREHVQLDVAVHLTCI